MLALLRRWLGRVSPPASTTEANSRALFSSLLLMAWFVEARDPYTGGHLWRVSRYARLLAQAMGLPAAEVARISLGGFLHDLGKIAIPDAILRKSGALDEGEYAIVRTHPQVGLRLLAGHPLAGLVQQAVHCHHERPDGTGYPRGLKGQALALDARIVGLCDAFDAMTSSRPYRPGMSRDQALAIVQGQAGSQFDAGLCRHFVEMGRLGLLDHVMGHSDEGIPLQECPMCGPTLVLRREQRAGERVFCRNCAGEFCLESSATGLLARPTGRAGTPEDLQPEVDHQLIRQTLADALSNMPLAQMLGNYPATAQ